MAPEKETLIRVVAPSTPRQDAVCRGCHAPIFWVETLNGKRMPMNAYALPRHVDTGIAVYAASDAHWASCSARAQFDKRTRKDV